MLRTNLGGIGGADRLIVEVCCWSDSIGNRGAGLEGRRGSGGAPVAASDSLLDGESRAKLPISELKLIVSAFGK